MSEHSDQMNATIRGSDRVTTGAVDTEASSQPVGFDGGARKSAPQQRTAAQWFNDLVDETLHGGPVTRGRQ